jgi:hypothetical protein
VNRKLTLLSSLLVFLLSIGVASARAQDQSQPSQGQQPQGQDQTQQGQDQQQQQPKKKKGGFFGGLKAATGQGSQETEATRTAGSKTIGEGAKIGDVQPTGADRQKVTEMEKYLVPQKDLKKFQDDGHLTPKQ